MDNNQYAALAGTLLSLAGFYFPGFKTWFEKQTSDKKQLVMLGLIFIAVGARFALGCLGRDHAFACSVDGAWDALFAYGLAIVFNAGIYKGINYVAGKK